MSDNPTPPALEPPPPQSDLAAKLPAKLDPKRLAWIVVAHPAFHLAAVLILTMAGRRQLWGGLARLPQSVYAGFSPLWASLHLHPIQIRWLIIVVACAACMTIRWRDLDEGKAMRIGLCFVAFFQMWIIAGAPYNLYTDRGYPVERLLALALFALTVYRPAFFPLLTALTMTFVQQDDILPRGNNWTEQRFLLDFEIAFASWLVVRRVFKAPASSFLLSALVLFGGAYMMPFISKIELGEHPFSWALHDSLGNLFMASWASGWSHLAKPTAEGIAAFLNQMSRPMCWATLVVEAGACLALLHRRLAMLTIGSAMAMHFFIYLASGIAFWKWGAVEVALLFMVWRAGTPAFRRWPLWVRGAAVVVVALCPWTLKPEPLAWWDTRLTQTYRIEVLDTKGKVYEVDPHVFAPFDVPIVQGRIDYVAKEPHTVGPLGAVMSQGRWAQMQRTNANHAPSLLRGSTAFNDRKAKHFDRVVATALRNYAKHHGKPEYWPATPMHIQQGTRAPLTWNGEHVVTARIRYRVDYFDGKHLTTLVDRPVREIDIATGRGDLAPSIDVPAVPRPHTPEEAGADLDFRAPCDADDKATLALLGDVAVHAPLSKQVLADGYDSLIGGLREPLAQADAAWVNLEGTAECCLDDKGKAHPDPGPHWDNVVYTASDHAGLNFHPSLIAGLKAVGVTVIDTVNNHSFDRGVEGIKRTLDNLDAAGVPHFGTRRTTSDPLDLITKVGDMHVAWIGCTFWTNGRKDLKEPGYLYNCRRDKDEMLSAIHGLAGRPDVDAVVFVMHGGDGHMPYGFGEVRRVAKLAADAGATIVASCHPHLMQTWEKYVTSDGREALLTYSHGNFLTYVTDIEGRSSTITYVTIGKKHGDAKARVLEATHRPVFLALDRAEDKRHIVVPDPSTDDEEQRQSLRLAWERFGRSRALAPGEDPHRACADRPHPAPYFGEVGDACRNDEGCDTGLSCAKSGQQTLCSKRCTSDDECVTSVGAGKCYDGACYRACSNSDPCDELMPCRHGACVPKESTHSGH